MRSSIALAVVVAAATTSLGCGGPSQKGSAPAPDPVDKRLEAAKRHERARRYDLAEREYRAAVAAADTPAARARARRELADALLFWGMLAEGAKVLEELVGEAPTHVPAWHDLGIVRQQLGDAAGAERALVRSIELAPHDPRSHIALAAILVNQRRLREAQQQYRALLEMQLPAKLRRAVERALVIIERELAGPQLTPTSP